MQERREDFMEYIKRIAGSALEVALGIFLLAILVNVWGARESKAAPLTPARSPVSASLPQAGTICIVDDSNHNQLQVDPTTGAYTFTDCASFTLTGTGVVTTMGCTVVLQHVAPDRRVLAKIDLCGKRATASAQTYSPSILKTITDRNTANDVCGCGDAMAIVIKGKPRKFSRSRR
jgi:hypothetical protein